MEHTPARPVPRSPIIRDAAAFWAAKAAGGMPSLRSVRPQEMPRLLPHLMIFDVLEPLDFRYRLVGGAVRERLVRDRTGQRLSEIPGQGPDSALWRHLDAVRKARMPSWRAPPYVGPAASFLEIENLVCPLSSDGESVDAILVFIDFVSRRLGGADD